MGVGISNLTGGALRVTQGVSAGASIPPIFSVSASFEREGPVGSGVPLGERLTDQPFTTRVESFTGLEGGAALIFGGNFRVGLTTDCEQ